MMSRFARLSFAFMLTFSACAEGGSRGSGLSTVIGGNVVGLSETAPAGASLESIRVSIAGTRIHGVTDAHGAFSFHGNFEGMVGVRFALPKGGGQAQLTSNVPANGRLTLSDVTIDTVSGEAHAARQGIEFEAIIVSVDCTAMTATVVSQRDKPDNLDQYLLRLDTSSVVDAQGNPIRCTALVAGDTASVDGTVNPDGSFGNATVVVGD